jgi:hypothetical protein
MTETPPVFYFSAGRWWCQSLVLGCLCTGIGDSKAEAEKNLQDQIKAARKHSSGG